MDQEKERLKDHLLSIGAGKMIVGIWIGEKRSLEGSGALPLQVIPVPDYVGYLSKDHWPFRRDTFQIGIIEVNSSSATLIDIKGWLLIRPSTTHEGVTTSAVPERFRIDE